MSARLLSRALRPATRHIRSPRPCSPNHASQYCRALHSTAGSAKAEKTSPRTLFPIPFALLATSLAVTAHSEAAPLQTEPSLSPLTRVEHHTGVSFPTSLSPTEHLSGVGARFMRGIVKVYAVGIYMDSAAARAALADWKGFSADDIVSADPLWTIVCSPQAGFARTVRMVVVRDVDGWHMQNGFERALLGRVAAAAKMGRCRPKECKSAAKQFCALFTQVGTMKIGSDIRISVDKDLVTLVIDGRLIGNVRNVQLAWAVLDMFVGDTAVVRGLREEVAKGLEHVLNE